MGCQKLVGDCTRITVCHLYAILQVDFQIARWEVRMGMMIQCMSKEPERDQTGGGGYG